MSMEKSYNSELQVEVGIDQKVVYNGEKRAFVSSVSFIILLKFIYLLFFSS